MPHVMFTDCPDCFRIDAACFVDGNDDEFIVEFWSLPGSIVRTCYNRRTTATTRSFVAVRSWEYDALRRMADAQAEGAFYSI